MTTAFTYPTRTLTFSAEDVATMDHYAVTEAADHVFDNTPLLQLTFRSIKQPGLLGPTVDKIFSELGISKPRVRMGLGKRARMPLAVGSSTNTMSFRRGDTLRTNIDEGLTAVESEYAYYTDFASLYWQDVIENSGDGKDLDRMQEQIDAVYRSFANLIATDQWSTQADVSASQKKIPGIQNIISTTNTSGTAWGLSRSSPNTFWQSNADTVASFATNGIDKLRTMRISCSANGGVDSPNLIISPSAVWGYGVKQLEGIHRVTDIARDGGELSSKIVRHMGTPWMWDDSCPSGTLYMLNLNYLLLFMHSKAANYIEHPANPNNALIAHQMRIATGLTWGIQRPDRFGVLSSITA